MNNDRPLNSDRHSRVWLEILQKSFDKEIPVLLNWYVQCSMPSQCFPPEAGCGEIEPPLIIDSTSFALEESEEAKSGDELFALVSIYTMKSKLGDV